MQHLERFRPPGTRNWINVGHFVKVTPPRGRAFLARVRRLDADEHGDVVAVHLVVEMRCNHSDHPQRGMSRVVTPDRISRVAQTRIPQRAEA